MRAWLADVTARTDWAGGSAVWLGSALQEASPFNTPWRREKGGLWDLGPHLVALLWSALGPVTRSAPTAARGEVTHLVLHHAGGAASSVSITMSVPERAEFFELFLWGAGGRSAVRREAGDAVAPAPDRADRTGRLCQGRRRGSSVRRVIRPRRGARARRRPAPAGRRPRLTGSYLMCSSFLALVQVMTTSVGVRPHTPANSSVSLSPNALPLVT